jgi:error-prone DNA polymerase
MFVELLGRSCFSFLRGASQPEELMERALELGLSGLGLCDVNGLYGTVRAWTALRETRERAVPFRYIVGAELTLTSSEDDDAPTLALLIENAHGYQNLCELLTLARDGRPKGQCQTSLSALHERALGLSALLIPPQRQRPVDAALGASLRQCFGERLSIGVYRHLDGFDRSRERWALDLAEQLASPIVASARPNYHLPSRQPLSDVLFCIRHGQTLDQAGTELSANAERFLRSEAEMRRLFRDHEEWVDASGVIAERCQFDFSQLRYHFPCELEPGQTADERLAELTWEGAGRRYPTGLPPVLRGQLKKELALIKRIGVAPYFLSTQSVVQMARRRRILCQGRGSAANSAVCYVLGITAVDPSRSNLLFERFLSEERAEPPDIDIDFEHERREEVIQEIYETYGRDRAAMVSEVISYRGKSALREVGKAFGLSLEQVDLLSSTVSWTSLSESTDRRLTQVGLDVDDPRLKQVMALAAQLQGFPRHLSIHVGGFVLSSRPLSEVAPIEPARMPGRTIIPWDKDDIDALGFFKVDVLGLGMLTAIRKALELITASGGLVDPRNSLSGTSSLADTTGSFFDPLEVITRIPPEDRATYDMICRADTVGVFQIESRAQMSMLPRLRPRRFYDLVVEVAIVRPGPIQGGMVHPYLRRRNGEEPITCPHPELWPILERTHGVPLFQEQVMQIAIVGAGYSGGEADQLRRDMAAWKKTGRLLRHRQRLLAGFARKGIEPSFGEALFEQIKGFGEYGFPESHASSFALLVYASSWQKCHYPAHFTCAVLNAQPMGFYQPTSLVRDAQKHGVEVRDVCVLQSSWDSTLEAADPEQDRIVSRAPGSHRALRLGLRLVKGLPEVAAARIVQLQGQAPPTSVVEFARRAQLPTRDVEILAEAGALERIEAGRRAALWSARSPRTPGLFAELDATEPRVTLPLLHAADQLVLDYEHKGLSLGDHPLRYYRRRLRRLGARRAEDLLYLPRGTKVKLGGLVMSRQRPGTASGVVFITLEDETGTANLIVHSSVFERYEHVARHAQLLLVVGEIERDHHLPMTPRPVAATGVAAEGQAANAEVARHADGAPITPVIHVVVRHLEALGRPEAPDASRLRVRSRDFH